LSESLRVLLVGASGQVGQACTQTAPDHVELRRCTHADLDITDAANVVSVVDEFRPDLLINTAAYTAVDKAESNEPAARLSNAVGVGNLAAAIARHAGARMVHISTDFVFDGKASSPYSPEAPTAPLNVYGATKLAGEHAARAALGERVAILRTAWVYSATGANFVRTMLRLMTNGSVRVIADQVGTPTSAVSLAEVIWRIAAGKAGGVFHWTDAGVASWYDFAVAIAEEGSRAGLLTAPVEVTPIATSDYPTPARRPAYSVLDKSATVARFGLKNVHWRVRLRTVIEQLRGA
jgi:dTDP-4-dehydrorhamnose reductase